MYRVGDFTLTWGESLRWDDRRNRLYFVDCATQRLYWLDDAEPPLHELQLPGMATGVVLTEGDELLICLDDGLHVVDADASSVELLSPYPSGIYGRANDATADGFGNLLTGTLNLEPGPGALWSFSARRGWQMLIEPFGSANGPVVTEFSSGPTLVIGDTLNGVIHAYPYDGSKRRVGTSRTIADRAALGGAPDGATADAAGAVWSCVLGSGRLVRLTESGIDNIVELPVRYPSDVAFGGEGLGRLLVTSIALDLGEGDPGADGGRVLVSGDCAVSGRRELRFELT